MNAITVKRLIMHAAFEVDVEIAFPGKADPSMELDRSVRNIGPRIGCRALGHPGSHLRIGMTGVDQTSCVVEQGSSSIDSNHRIDQGMLDGLKKTNRTLELLSGLGVFDGRLKLPLAGPAQIGTRQAKKARPRSLKDCQTRVAHDRSGIQLDSLKVKRGLITGDIVNLILLDPEALGLSGDHAKDEVFPVTRQDNEELTLGSVLYKKARAVQAQARRR